MGKGDKKSRRGKIVRGTHGVRRPRKKKKNSPVVEPKAAKVSKTVKKVAEPVVKEVTEEKPVAKKTAAKAKKKETPVVELPEKPEPQKTPAEEKPAQEDQAGE